MVLEGKEVSTLILLTRTQLPTLSITYKLMETIDNYLEHCQHNTFLESCSECYRENRLIKAHQTVNWDLLYPDGSRNDEILSRSDNIIDPNPLG